MFVVATVKAGVEDVVVVTVVVNHDILISTASTEREDASIINLQFSDVSFLKINLFGLHKKERWRRDRGRRVFLGLG